MFCVKFVAARRYIHTTWLISKIVSDWSSFDLRLKFLIPQLKWAQEIELRLDEEFDEIIEISYPENLIFDTLLDSSRKIPFSRFKRTFSFGVTFETES